MIEEAFQKIKESIPQNVDLIAVSKTKPMMSIMKIYHLGHRLFGENKVQELVEKYHDLPKDIEWHMIGHLQTNKVKYIAPFVKLIHGVDSLKLLTEIDKQAIKNKRIIDVLLQFHIAQEESKFGLKIEDVEQIMSFYQNKTSVRIVGVMGMASFVDDQQTVRAEFQSLRIIFNELKNNYFKDEPTFRLLSMGMSGDYETAIEEGSNMVRIGSSIFGERN